MEADRPTMQRQGNVVVLLGPPGAGKGTQAERLSSSLGTPSISTGEILRRECRSGSALGLQVKSLLDAGQLVSDDLMEEVVAQRLAEPDCAQGCILDGFPRTASQARFLERHLIGVGFAAPIVFDFSIEAQYLINRLSSRRQCPACGRTFQAAEGASDLCPNDSARLIVRDDDRPETIRRRLQIYSDNTAEIVRFYQNRGGYYRLDATEPVEKISQRLLNLLAPRPITAGKSSDFPRPLIASHRLYA